MENAKTELHNTAEVKPEAGGFFAMGKKGTLWLVLDVDKDAGTALVLAEKDIGYMAYNSKKTLLEDVTWETCTLRRWLNNDYYNSVFSEAEKAVIIESELHNPDNPKHHSLSRGGNDTRDKIFLLSIEEAEKYFKDNEDRATGCWWWLRSPGSAGTEAAGIYSYGGISYSGDFAYHRDRCGVRPAFRINLRSELFQSLTYISQVEKVNTEAPPDNAEPEPHNTDEVRPEAGAYFTMGKEGSLWVILDVDKNAETALVLAEKDIDYRPYHDRKEAVTWETCTLRKWLNSEYYKSAFSNTQKEAIIESELENPNNPEYWDTYGGNTTRDKIFLLSIDEARKYINDYHILAINREWWLRSPGEDSCHAAYIDYKGIYTIFGNHVNVKYSVRPAFRIDMKSKFFRSLLTAGQSGDVVFKNPPQHVPVEIEIRDRDYL